MTNIQVSKEQLYAVKDQLEDLMDYAMDSMKEFSLEDVAIWKICMISFGILLGITFTKFFKKVSPIVKIAFLLSYFYIMWRVFSEEDKD